MAHGDWNSSLEAPPTESEFADPLWGIRSHGRGEDLPIQFAKVEPKEVNSFLIEHVGTLVLRRVLD